jgi:hypothetical protein
MRKLNWSPDLSDPQKNVDLSEEKKVMKPVSFLAGLEK